MSTATRISVESLLSDEVKQAESQQPEYLLPEFAKSESSLHESSSISVSNAEPHVCTEHRPHQMSHNAAAASLLPPAELYFSHDRSPIDMPPPVNLPLNLRDSSRALRNIMVGQTPSCKELEHMAATYPSPYLALSNVNGTSNSADFLIGSSVSERQFVENSDAVFYDAGLHSFWGPIPIDIRNTSWNASGNSSFNVPHDDLATDRFQLQSTGTLWPGNLPNAYADIDCAPQNYVGWHYSQCFPSDWGCPSGFGCFQQQAFALQMYPNCSVADDEMHWLPFCATNCSSSILSPDYS